MKTLYINQVTSIIVYQSVASSHFVDTSIGTMTRLRAIVVLVILYSSRTDAASCPDGWTAYRDELCIRTFTNNLLTFEEAKAYCVSYGTELSTSSLVMVKDSYLQQFLADFTHDIFDNIWLGSKYDNASSQFKWLDGEPLTYTNWQEGYPTNSTDSEQCIEMKPVSKLLANVGGKWTDAPCRKRNLVMCQMDLPWTLKDAIEEIKRLRQQHEDDINDVRKELNETKQNLEAVNSRVVPVGSIYLEYFNQSSPLSLWPDLEWDDITDTYAGLFFRAGGGNAADWGTTQSECAPRITQMGYTWRDTVVFPDQIDIPPEGWSEFCNVGVSFLSGSSRFRGLRLNTGGCEVRPQNQAMRVWRRVK